MTTGRVVEADRPTRLRRYVFGDGQSDVQRRLASGISAPTVAEKIAEMRRHLESLGHGPTAANEEQQNNKMARELEKLAQVSGVATPRQRS
ncbi:hypothetical protein FVEN_g12763 [Fusarium venenatum]|uniref:Uncharacterized protein n=1 Tax=Fusarium venenatum TaxID=56646 RepID=A0A2L2TDQ7_9HYPO|nr:uncharacterized protein FVRRES_02685 [Fusarium venenatum]KAG8357997.1 hypothetical protein FVEN_g12763 [Fusarium venenatum]CEI66173.1 unnamed protein product [Fusarium venenatum]